MMSTDVLIVGAGPVGLFAVFELGLLDLECHVVEVLQKPGGQCSEYYPEKPIYDIPGVPVCTGQELTERLLQQIEPFSPRFHFGELVEEVRRADAGRWAVKTSGGLQFDAGVIVIAAGAGSFTPKRPPIPHIERHEGVGVQYAVRRIEALRGRRIVIAGGGDSAVDWVLSLHEVAARVTLVHRRAEFRAAPDSVRRVSELASAGKIDFVLGECVGVDEAPPLEAVTIKTNAGERLQAAADVFLPFYGLTMKLGPIAQWGLNFSENRIAVDTEKFATSAPGIFAIGDINVYPGKLKLILSGFHEAALMAQQAFRHLRPQQKLLFQYTTTSTSLKKKLTHA
jgi:thioredoxin reductase (NADPH)